MLTPTLAQEIAADTSALIGFNVLITDAEGIVIGSGDTDRVGSFHEASMEVIRTMELAAHGPPEVLGMHGVKPGITLPLVIDGVAVGTVGITGSPARVKRFGLLVQRQTEILLHESAALQSGLLRARVLEDLVRDIAAFDADRVDHDFLVARGAELGYDLGLRRLAIVLEILPAPSSRSGTGVTGPDTSVLRPDLLRTLHHVFPDGQDVVTTTGSGRGAVLYHLTSSRSAGTALVACRRAVALAQAHHGVRLRAAVGSPADSIRSLHLSYLDASEALRLGAGLHPAAPIHSIDDLRVHQFVDAAGRRARTRLRSVLPDALRSQRDWMTLRSTLVAWCEHGFNLVDTAAALTIHRNTLVYRLAKIERLTGVELRLHAAYVAIYLACVADLVEELVSADVG